MSDKFTLRKKYIALRKSLMDDDVEAMSVKIANQSLKLDIWNKIYYHIFLTIAHKKEVNTDYIMHILQGKDKSIVVSKADFTTCHMHHILLQENTALKISGYGIPEPVSGIEIPPEMMDVVFVPLLAFDENGHRVGYGNGFYDRFLHKCKSDALFIGLSFFAPETKIDSGETDIPLDFCITPEKIYQFGNKKLSL